MAGRRGGLLSLIFPRRRRRRKRFRLFPRIPNPFAFVKRLFNSIRGTFRFARKVSERTALLSMILRRLSGLWP